MSFEITDWNVDPNQTWYVKISESASKALIEIYNTKADALAGINRIASGSADFGNNVEVTLAQDAGTTPAISLFNDTLSYHLKVSGQSGDAVVILCVPPFVDLPEINNSVYQVPGLIQKRAAYEINTHSSLIKNRDIQIANFNPDFCVGDCVRVQSNKRNIDALTTISEIIISATPASLINTLELKEYNPFTPV